MAAATPDLLVLSCKIFQVFFALLGLPLNGYTLLLVLFGRPTVYSCLLLCMSLSHLLFDVFVAAFELAAIILVFRPLSPDIGNSSFSTANTTTITTTEVQWPEPWPPVLRRLQICLWVVMPVVNLWIICALVLDRYLVIMRPWTHDDKLNRAKVLLLGLFTSLLILAGSVPFWSSLFSCNSSYISDSTTTVISHSLGILDLSDLALPDDKTVAPILWTVYMVAILVPSTVMLLCNSHLLFIILQHRSRILSTIYVVQLSSSASTASVYGSDGSTAGSKYFSTTKAIAHHQSESAQQKQQQQQQHKQRDLLLTTVHLFCSLLLFLPYSVWTVTSQLLFHCFHLRLTAATQLVLCLTPLYNCYNYGLRSPPVKKVAFHRALQRYLNQIQMINAVTGQSKRTEQGNHHHHHHHQHQHHSVRTSHSKAQSLSSILQPSSS